MAIDTATKRKSMLGFGSGDLLPNADGTIAIGDMLTFLWLYSGIVPALAVPNLELTLSVSQDEFTLTADPELTTLEG